MRVLIHITIWSFIAIGSILYFTTVTELSGTGAKIAKLKTEVASLERENRELTLEISSQVLLSRLEEEAQQKGLVVNTEFTYVQTPSLLVVSKK